jgi:hypothetical protein
MMDWGQFLNTYGLPLTILALLVWFFFHDLWPFARRQIDAWIADVKAERKGWDEERRSFLITLQQINANQVASTQAIQQIATAISRMETESKRAREREREKERGSR